MQGRGAHVHFVGQPLDLQRLVEILPQPIHRPADAMPLGAAAGDLAQLAAQLAAQQPVEDLPANQRQQHGDVFRGIQQAQQTQHRILQGCRQTVDRQAAGTWARLRGRDIQLHQQRTDFLGVQGKAQAEERYFRAGFQHLANHRDVDRYDEELRRPVEIGFLAQQYLLAPLDYQAEGGLVEAVQGLAGEGGAIHQQAGNVRFIGAILAGESFNELHQLLLLARSRIRFLRGKECMCIHGFDPRRRWVNSTHDRHG